MTLEKAAHDTVPAWWWCSERRSKDCPVMVEVDYRYKPKPKACPACRQERQNRWNRANRLNGNSHKWRTKHRHNAERAICSCCGRNTVGYCKPYSPVLVKLCPDCWMRADEIPEIPAIGSEENGTLSTTKRIDAYSHEIGTKTIKRYNASDHDQEFLRSLVPSLMV